LRPTCTREPGVCSNTLALPLAQLDEDVLSTIEGEVLRPSLIEKLLTMVDAGAAESHAALERERDRLAQEIANLVQAIKHGVPGDTVAPEIRRCEQEKVKVEAKLRAPRPEALNLERLRAALEQRSDRWKTDLRSEPKVARLIVRKLVGPITLWEEAPEWLRWEAPATPERLLDGLADRTYLVASPPGFEPGFQP
jgi:hypothetical protein